MIEHVRLLQISSEVFAKEVEPTGLLTMEQTLARSVVTGYTVGWEGLTGACELLLNTRAGHCYTVKAANVNTGHQHNPHTQLMALI